MRHVLWDDRSGVGTEYFVLATPPGGAVMLGTVLLADEGAPFKILYEVRCDEAWCTRAATVRLISAGRSAQLDVSADDDCRWRIDDRPQPQVNGCTDLDLSFTPATNTLPIRRLRLQVGESAQVSAAWLRWPELTLERLAQTYERVADDTYTYRAGSFLAQLVVDEEGIVLDYERAWRAVARR